MLKDCVLVLGSGKSILNLSFEERNLLNSCNIKIAINKFSAFYEKSKIVPTHIYFEDKYDSSSILMLKYIFKLFRKKKIKKLTFIISEDYKNYLFENYFGYIFFKYFNYFKFNLNLILVKLGRIILKKINVLLFNKFVLFLTNNMKIKSNIMYNLLPKDSKTHYIRVENYEKKHSKWANSLNKPLYHFKGSFSSVLNYVSICYPNKTILLIGVDFNTSDYFFENELKKLNFKTKDWTYELRKKHNKHFSVIETNGVKIDDEFPFMLKELRKTNNMIYSLNKNSYLVAQGFVEKKSLKSFC